MGEIGRKKAIERRPRSERPAEVRLSELGNDPAARDAAMVTAARDVLSNRVELHDSRWATSTLHGKLSTLNAVEVDLARSQGREATPVLLALMATEQNACVSRGFDFPNIQVNAALLGDRDRCLETLVHEGRHRYQKYAAAHPGIDARGATWQHNWDHYVDPNRASMAAYLNQPVEVDARAFADRVSDGLDAGSAGGVQEKKSAFRKWRK